MPVDKWTYSVRGEVLPDVLSKGLDVVFCGSAAGEHSARAAAYYAGPGNRFWPTLFEIGLLPERIQPPAFRCVLQYGLGLTDLAKETAGSDVALSVADYDTKGLRKKIDEFEPRLLAFNGKRAASLFLRRQVAYGLQDNVLGRTHVYVLPSTSGAARRFWHVEPWCELVVWLKKENCIR